MNSRLPKSQSLVFHLADGAQLFLRSIRQWLASAKQGECGCCAMRSEYQAYGIEAALPVLTEIMCFLLLVTNDELDIQESADVETSDTEISVLRMMIAVEANQPSAAYELASDYFSPPVATTFIRICDCMIEHYKHAGLVFAGTPTLRLV